MSVLVDAPTEIVPGVAAGVVLHALVPEFPAAATTTIPSAINAVIFASISASRVLKPMLIFTTAGSPGL
ncbi:unannotated protein [freshwater metagenome]|uniref:Unannotated protein n=1 Tax=freshwater metagenome TaxID=449393 RepID=A0A6J6MSG2_9ZZZZ